jgi:UDP-galactopyranose mutase
MEDVTIVGAGVAGCTVGHLLSERGYDVTVVEKDAVGGLLREIKLDSGVHCDSAPHLLFYDEEEEAVVGELFSEFANLDWHEFYAKTYPTNDLEKPHDYPVSRANIDRWDDAEQIHEELAAAPGKTDADYFREYVRRQVGPTLYERYYEHYTKKHWGVDPGRITGDWFDFKINFPDAEEEFFGGGAYYPRRKYTDILNEMLSDCEVVFEGVTGLDTDGDRIKALRTEDGGHVGGDIFISTIDPSILVDVDASLEYRSMIIHGIHLEASERPFPDHVDWAYFPNHHPFTRITEYGFTPQHIPEGEYVLTTEFPCFVGDEIWSRSREWFDKTVVSFLEDQGIETERVASEIRRAPRAYPLPVEEEVEKFERINGRLSAYENVANLGRVSTYEYIWIKDIVQQAYDTVEELAPTKPS